MTNDSFAAVRASVGSAGRGPARSRPGPAAAAPRSGRWPCSARRAARAGGRWSRGSWSARDGDRPTARAVAVAGLLLERHGVLTREAVRGEGVPGGFAGVYPVLRAMEESGRIRRGYFVAGLGGAQFALPGAVDRLRGMRDGAGGAASPRPAFVAGGHRSGQRLRAGRCPGRSRDAQRVAGAYVVLVDGVASLYVERGGKGLVALREFDGRWEDAAVEALAEGVRSRRWSRLVLQRYPEELESYLRAAAFVPSPKGLVRYG